MRARRALYRLQTSGRDSGKRLDQFLAEQVENLSRTQLRKIIDLGGVHVEGRRQRKCTRALQGDEEIEVHVDGLSLEPFVVRDAHILYRDKFLLALNKPAGVDTQPTHARFKGTLYEALLRMLQDPWRPHLKPELGMVQRLDRDTSGVMVFSIHPQAHKGLTAAVSGREITKVYLALVAGCPCEGQGEIRSRLVRSRNGNRMMSVTSGGREAVTRYRVLETFSEAALLEVQPVTGRSHQIRVHLAELGHPLLGDGFYGGPDQAGGLKILRHLLHSRRLILNHPVSGRPLEVEAPLPEDLSAVLEAFRRGTHQPAT